MRWPVPDWLANAFEHAENDLASLPEWARPVLVPPFWECSDCPDPARCRVDGCHGMDGVKLTAEELGEIG